MCLAHIIPLLIYDVSSNTKLYTYVKTHTSREYTVFSKIGRIPPCLYTIKEYHGIYLSTQSLSLADREGSLWRIIFTLAHDSTSCYKWMKRPGDIFTVVVKKCFGGFPANIFLEILDVHRRKEVAGCRNLPNVMCVWDTIRVCPSDKAHQFSRDHSGR